MSQPTRWPKKNQVSGLPWHGEQLIQFEDQTLKLIPGDELVRKSNGGAFRIYWGDSSPIYLSIPTLDNNCANWTESHNWKSCSSVTINKSEISLYAITQWLAAANLNEQFLQAIGIIFDDDYFMVKKLYEEIMEFARAVMEPHIGKYDSRDLKINVIL
jgi:hypothetical protein